MPNLRDIRRKSRRDLHLKAQVPAFYLRTREAEPALCHVRLHFKDALVGNLSGARVFGAQIEDQSDQVVFDLLEISTAERGGIVCFAEGEAYAIDRMKPAMGEFRTAEVTKLPATQAEDLPFPDPEA